MADYKAIIDKLSEIKAELNANITIIDDVIKPRLDEIIQHQKTTNGRVTKTEGCINELQLIVEKGVLKCEFIQDAKARAVVRNRWIIGTLLVVIGLLSGMFYKTKQYQEVPVELIYRKTDSTFIVPNMYFRRYGEKEFLEVHKVYVDIKDRK